MNKITFVIFTYNEEKRVADVIKNFRHHGEVLILDAGSTDQTKAITIQMGARFLERPKSDATYIDTQVNLDFVRKNIDSEWVYWGCADVLAPFSLLNKIQESIQSSRYKMIKMPFYTYLWGLTQHLTLKARSAIVFHKDYIDFTDNQIHCMGKFLGTNEEILVLPHDMRYALRHFSLYNLEKFVHGHLRYANTEALEKYSRGQRFSMIKTLAAMLRYMWIYGRHGYRNGKLGFLIMLNYAMFRLMTYTRLYEIEQGIDLSTVEGNYRSLKDKLLEDFN